MAASGPLKSDFGIAKAELSFKMVDNVEGVYTTDEFKIVFQSEAYRDLFFHEIDNNVALRPCLEIITDIMSGGKNPPIVSIFFDQDTLIKEPNKLKNTFDLLSTHLGYNFSHLANVFYSPYNDTSSQCYLPAYLNRRKKQVETAFPASSVPEKKDKDCRIS